MVDLIPKKCCISWVVSVICVAEGGGNRRLSNPCAGDYNRYPVCYIKEHGWMPSDVSMCKATVTKCVINRKENWENQKEGGHPPPPVTFLNVSK